ncbi:MAG TPA: peptide chain release factor-like protein [Candidatus Hydrogenedentes bacterium]|nr:peptide chain release factor-like protein [Candidatus Hydrogenedentota bacterium]HIJ73810.1 peptide chain release factor-like protein [Candidatus Hydrogenedentota bacterium]
MQIPCEDIKITFYKSSGPGGQKKNTTLSAVRVLHLPTGIMVVSTAARSQHQNKQLALKELERRLAARRRRRRPRLASRPTPGAVERRVQRKKRRGALKRLRRPPHDE